MNLCGKNKHNMQNQWLRIIVFILLTGIVAIYFYTGRQEDHYNANTPKAINQILTEISAWEKPVLFRHLAEEAKQTINDEQLSQLFNLYRRFGRFRSIDELSFSRTASAFSLIGEKRIHYAGTAYFDIGLVNVNITLVERGGYFKIYNFNLTEASKE